MEFVMSLRFVGCQDNAYDNFNPDATDSVDCDGNPGTCTGLLGCTDSLYAEYYAVFPTYDDILADNSAGYEVDDNSCVNFNCCWMYKSSAATNFDSDANVNITDDTHPDVCVIEGAPNVTPLSDFPENTSIVLTGNNMSLLFQPEDESKFDASSTIPSW